MKSNKIWEPQQCLVLSKALYDFNQTNPTQQDQCNGNVRKSKRGKDLKGKYEQVPKQQLILQVYQVKSKGTCHC